MISHPVSRAQDLIDRLKTLTKPIDEAETKNIPEAWNELEDLLVMLASKPTVGLVRAAKDATLDSAIAAIDALRTTEKRDADSDEEPGRINTDRGSSDGNDTGH